MHKFRRYFKRRQKHVAGQAKVLDFLQDFSQIRERLRPVREALAHFRLGSEVELAVREAIPESAAAANRRRFFLGFLDAKQNVVGFGLGLVEVKRIVGRHRLHTVGGAEALEHDVYRIFFGQTVAVDFGVKICAKLGLPPQKRFLGLLFAYVENELRHFTHYAAGGHHDPLFVGEQQVAVDARNVVKPIDVGDGTELRQVVVAGFVFGQERNLEPVVFLATVQVVTAQVGVHAHDGFQFRGSLRTIFVVGLHPLDKLKSAHHVPEVGQGYRRLSVGGRPLNEVRNLGGSLKHTKLAVNVQVKKRHVGIETLDRAGGFGQVGGRRSGRSRRPQCGARLLEVSVLQPDGRNHVGVGCDKGLELVGLHPELRGLPMPNPNQFPKTTGRGFDVGCGVVGLCEGLAKELGVQLTQLGGLKSSATGNPNQGRRLGCHRIEHRLRDP